MNSSTIFYWVDLFYLKKGLLGLKGSKNLERRIYNKTCCTYNFDAERLEGLMKTFFQKWSSEIKLKNVQCNCDTRNIAWMLTNIRFGIYPLKEFSTTNIASFWKQCKTLITLTDFKTKINPHSSKSKCEHALERIAPIWLRPLLIINLREVGNEKKNGNETKWKRTVALRILAPAEHKIPISLSFNISKAGSSSLNASKEISK